VHALVLVQSGLVLESLVALWAKTKVYSYRPLFYVIKIEINECRRPLPTRNKAELGAPRTRGKHLPLEGAVLVVGAAVFAQLWLAQEDFCALLGARLFDKFTLK
jgi:hypothetical protein